MFSIPIQFISIPYNHLIPAPKQNVGYVQICIDCRVMI